MFRCTHTLPTNTGAPSGDSHTSPKKMTGDTSSAAALQALRDAANDAVQMQFYAQFHVTSEAGHRDLLHAHCVVYLPAPPPGLAASETERGW